MTQAQLAEVFADHPVRPCSELPDLRDEVFGEPSGEPTAKESTFPAMDFTVSEDLQTEYAIEHADTFGWLMVDQAAGAWIVGVTADVEEHEQWLAALYPEETFRVIETPHNQNDLAAAQEAVMPLHQGEDPIVVGSGYFAYLELHVVYPTRQDLDAIAELVDPTVVCVDPVLSGLTTDGSTSSAMASRSCLVGSTTCSSR